jgi:hypothetical protein
MEAEQRLKQQAAPLFFNFDGNSGPILITRSQHSSQGRSCTYGDWTLGPSISTLPKIVETALQLTLKWMMRWIAPTVKAWFTAT